PTTRRVRLTPDALPTSYYDQRSSAGPWNESDGFSTGGAILTQFRGLTLEGLAASGVATSTTIERSLEAVSPTVLLNVATGQRIAHWAELDESTDNVEERALIIRPAKALDHNTRYIVAIRDLQGVEVSEAFDALRIGERSSDPTVGPRRALYRDIFEHLDDAGVGPKEELQLAWDFTTASQANITDWMLHMRDQSLALVGDAGPVYEIVSVEENPWPDEDDIAYRIYGEMQVPLYLTTTQPGALLIFDEDSGRPMQNPAAPWAKFSFEILIPDSARTEPAKLMQYGHGLLGEKEQIQSSHFRSWCNEYNYAIFGVDFVGMAADDEVYVGAVVSGGRFDDFSTVVYRQHQGMLNSLLAMRMMIGGMSEDDEFGQYLDGSKAYYHGISQGGIFGGTYMALTTDVRRGALGVMGMPYNLLLNRSVDFDVFFDLIKTTYTDARDVQILLALAQQLWDRVEPNGYAAHIMEDTFRDTPEHQVLMRGALGDHQVSAAGSHFMARTIGVHHVETGQGAIFGLDSTSQPHTGSALVEYNFGLPPDPEGNLPQRECEDPHGKLRKLEAARQQLDFFFREGVVRNFCDDGKCDFEDMSGCP
ncbi:MAG: Ig-like domain-containing protein, partial [Myxococcota bacterium]